MRVGADSRAGSMPAKCRVVWPYFKVELVHGGGEVGAVAGVGEEFGLVFVFGDEVAKSDADEEGPLELGALRTLGPERAQDFEEGEGVLAVAEARLHAPAGVFDAGVVLLRFRAFGLFARELVANGDGQGAGVEVLHAEAHGGFVEELVRDGPGAFGASGARARGRGSGRGISVLQPG